MRRSKLVVLAIVLGSLPCLAAAYPATLWLRDYCDLTPVSASSSFRFALAFTTKLGKIWRAATVSVRLPDQEDPMSRNDSKKQRREQKRREKRVALRRAEQGANPFHRIGAAGEVSACYINRAWRESGLASIQLLRRVPGGGHALAAFLVDLTCIGLKDAFGRLDYTAGEFDAYLQRSADQGAGLVPVDLATARRLVAGAIRWSHEHNFRLPPRYERWVALLGDIGDWHTADLTGFGVNGKLRYIGQLEDLRRRLIGTTLDEFLARPDVDFIGGLGPSTLDDEDADVVEEGVELFQERALDAVRRWCFANGHQPHPRLAEAVEVMLTGMLQTPDMGEDALDETAQTACGNVERLLSMESARSESELREAFDQLIAFTRSFPDPEALAAALGLELPPDEDPAESATPWRDEG